MKGGGESGEPPRTDEPPGSLLKDEQDMADLEGRLIRMSRKKYFHRIMKGILGFLYSSPYLAAQFEIKLCVRADQRSTLIGYHIGETLTRCPSAVYWRWRPSKAEIRRVISRDARSQPTMPSRAVSCRDSRLYFFYRDMIGYSPFG